MMYYLMIFGSTPWPCRDVNSFLMNLMHNPLRFPYNKAISEESKDFIQRCLVVIKKQKNMIIFI